jgi:hypothetical protein
MYNSVSIPRIQRRKKTGVNPLLFLFFIWPFASLIASIKRFRQPYAKPIFILFCTYFGYTFIIPADTFGSADSARYAAQFVKMHNSAMSLDLLLALLYSEGTTYVDVYQPLVTWFLSRFTDNPHFLFAFFALVFGYYYANNLWIVLNRIKPRIFFPIFVFILTLALINPIWSINGVRMWTAAQIFVYGILLYFLNGDKKGLIWAASSILVHFSFLFPVSLLLGFIFLPKKLLLFYIFFLGSSLISEIDLLGLRDSLSFLPGPLRNRAQIYTQESVNIEQIEKGWHVLFAYSSLKWVQYILLTAIFLGSRRILKQNKSLYVLFCYTLFFFGWANISSLVPSGARFVIVANVLTFTFLILFFTECKTTKLLNWLKLLTIPLLLFFCIFSIRTGFDFIGILTLIGNPISALIIEETTPIIEFVKSLF